MARLPRLYAPGIAQHLVQRAAEGRRLFLDTDDYARFVALLKDAVRPSDFGLHAYVLLPDRVELLGTPGSPQGGAALLQSIARVYVPYVNRRSGRTGTLWRGRFRSNLVDPDAHLLDVMRFIETRPVVEGRAGTAADWPWSSASHHVGAIHQPFLQDHPRYWALSDTPFGRQATYRALLDTPLDGELVRRVRDTVDRGWALGDADFVEAMRQAANRRPQPLPRGRPRKA